jgi:hypothetical protein
MRRSSTNLAQSSTETVRRSLDADSPPLLLTLDETAALLRTTRKAVYAMVERSQKVTPKLTGTNRDVASKESILWIHLIPLFGDQKLDAITNAKVQQLKLHLQDKSPTVNNVLTVLSVMLKTAVEWEPIDKPKRRSRLPRERSCSRRRDQSAGERT